VKLKPVMSFVIAATALVSCVPESQHSVPTDLITDIDSSDEARVVPFIYYIEDDQVVRGECKAGSSFVRSQCTDNLKKMPELLFEKKVSLEVTREMEGYETSIQIAEQKIVRAKDDANSILVANHEWHRKIDSSNNDLNGPAGNVAKHDSKQTDLTGLEEQLGATEVAITSATGSQLQALQVIRTRLLSQIATVKSDIKTLETQRLEIEKAITTMQSEIVANNVKIDRLLDIQNLESARLPELFKQVDLLKIDLGEIAETMTLLRTDLIPYEIHAASSGFEKNKRWIKRYDLVMIGSVPSDEVIVGSANVSTSSPLQARVGYMFLKQITVSSKMDVRKLGIVLNLPVQEAHLSIYDSSRNLLVQSTPMAMVEGANEVILDARHVLEAGTYYIAVQGSETLSIKIGTGSGYYSSISNTYPNLPQTIGSFSLSSYDLALYIVGDKY